MRTRKTPLDVIEGGRGWKVERIDQAGGVLAELREVRELIEQRVRRAETAERIAREEVAALRAQVDRLPARNWWTRLRNKR